GVTLDDPLCGLEHEAVGRDELRRLGVLLEDRLTAFHGAVLWPAEIDGTVTRREAAGDLEDRRLLAGRPLRVDEARVVARIALQLCGCRVALPRVGLALEVVRLGHERHRHPHARPARRRRRLDTGDD